MDLNSSISATFSVLGFVNTLAYIDPGTGAMIWQLLLATAIGGMFYARSYIRKVISIFKFRKEVKKTDERPL